LCSLVFLGSEKYPYKGVLDQFANRSFADGTNAWTDTDHTAYTVTTAGEQGFLQLLPVYIDHILYPTITKSGYVTEVREPSSLLVPAMLIAELQVHHINGKGEDSGVVYSEMQARENTQQDIMALRYGTRSALRFMPNPHKTRAQRLLYHAESGYHSDTGGLLESIRTLSVEQSKANLLPPLD
jgi:Zn-dependent M16 (insulinase) family peptidase